MSVSRRRFLEIGGIVAASSAIPLQGAPLGVHAYNSSDEEASLHNLRIDQVEALVGETFSVEAGLGRPLQMNLVSVDEVPRYSDSESGEAFVMNFCLKRGSLPQGTYMFDNPKTGRCSLLIAPSGLKTKNYAAVVNHRRPA